MIRRTEFAGTMWGGFTWWRSFFRYHHIVGRHGEVISVGQDMGHDISRMKANIDAKVL